MNKIRFHILHDRLGIREDEIKILEVIRKWKIYLGRTYKEVNKKDK